MTKKIIKILAVIILLGLLAGFFYIQHAKPQRDGEIKLSNLAKDVSVLFDKYGIPHIYAKNDLDMYRALGYVHAQDRLFQMELLRRLSQGKLAEIMGKKLIGADRLFRTLGLEEYAQKWLESVSKRSDPKILEMMDAYLDGVNQFVKSGPTPVEFELLNIPQHEYSKQDILSIMGYMSFSFAQALKDDPLLTRLAQQLPQKYLDDLDFLAVPGKYQLPVDALKPATANTNNTKELKNNFNNAQQLAQITRNVALIINQVMPLGLFQGSNSWIVSAKKSASGKPIFVNDPHIAYSQPSVWYEADLHSDNTQVYGHFLALIPTPLLGFNKKLAWGLTMFENDDMDLYVERVNPENSKQYWAIDHWENFSIRTEVIKVKDQDDVKFEVWKSRHGPLVNSMLSSLSAKQDPLKGFDKPIAMWWGFFEPDNQQIEAFYDLPFADTLKKAAAAAEKIHAPGLNLMYANASGDIAWWATAKLPIHSAQTNTKLILDGASGKDDILGYYDFSHNPRLINPTKGYLYTANNQPEDMGDGLIAGYYAPRDRPQRIVKFLQSKEKFSATDMKKLLMDNTPPMALLIQSIAIPVLKKHQSEFSGNALTAITEFDKWSGAHDPDLLAPSIYTEFRLKFLQLTFADEIGDDFYINFQHGFLLDRSLWKLIPNKNSPWWDNIHTSNKETREQLIVTAWKQAISKLELKLGVDMQQWQWSNEVQLTHEHILGKVKPLDKLFNVGPFPSRAGIEAVNNLKFKSEGDELKIIVGPSTRRIIDFADVSHSFGINPTGQSGVVFDRHYADQAEDYANGKFRSQYINKKDILANLEGKLILRAVK